jgi:hypothetical protein
MRRWVRILLWFCAFGGALAVGAFIGAHSNPFGPEVESSNTLPPASTTTTPSLLRWRGAIKSVTSHDLYVGGSCHTDWTTRIAFTVDAAGSVTGDGVASRVGDLMCDFDNPQINTESYTVKVSGVYADGALTLRLTSTASSPTGASDYGGFEQTLLAGPRSTLTVQVGDAAALKEKVPLSRVDAEARGTYRSSNVITLVCKDCMAG